MIVLTDSSGDRSGDNRVGVVFLRRVECLNLLVSDIAGETAARCDDRPNRLLKLGLLRPDFRNLSDTGHGGKPRLTLC